MAYSQFTYTPNFQDKYGTLLRTVPNITVLTHANVIALQANAAANAVQNVEAKSFSGLTFRVDARIIIVCCGGIESPRLLLASDSVDPNGIGNRQDVVGRFFQDHPGPSPSNSRKRPEAICHVVQLILREIEFVTRSRW